MTKVKFFANAVQYWQAKGYGLRLANGAFLPSAEGADFIKMQEIYPALFKGSAFEFLSSPGSLDNLRISSTIPGSDKDRQAIIETMNRLGRLTSICGMKVAMKSGVRVHVCVCTIMDGDVLSDDEIVGRFAGLHNVATDCRRFAVFLDFGKRAVVEHRGLISFTQSARLKAFNESSASKCTHAPILTRVSTQVWAIDLEAESLTPFVPGISLFGPNLDAEKQWFFNK